MNPLYLVTAAMFGQMSIAYMASLVLPVVAPAVAEEMGLDPALIGFYSACLYGVAMIVVNAVGPLIERFGGLRVGQTGLMLLGAGIAVAAFGWLPALVASAVILGLGMSMCTPSSSHVVGQFCTPRQGPLFFSIKQTGVAVGGLMAGFGLPALVLVVGWRGAVLVAAALAIALSLSLQPLRSRVDTARRAAGRFSIRQIPATLRVVVSDPGLREIAAAGFTFVGLQSMYGSFLVTFLVHALGYSLSLAGSIFAVTQGSALVTRILWGAAAAYMPARRVLAILGLFMGAAGALTGAYASSWPMTAVVVVAALFGATGFSWQGVLFAEVARLAPDGRVGTATSGVMFFIYVAMSGYPLLYAAVLAVTGDYALGFYLLSAPVLGAFVLLLRRRPGGRRA